MEWKLHGVDGEGRILTTKASAMPTTSSVTALKATRLFRFCEPSLTRRSQSPWRGRFRIEGTMRRVRWFDARKVPWRAAQEV